MTSTRDRRLQSDNEKVIRLVSESGGSLKLLRTNGVPPVKYVIEYSCPSLVKDATGKLAIRQHHEVEINLGADYPLKKPTAKMVTAVFNPHVWENNAICLGGLWSAAETLDTIVIRIGALLQLDPKVLDEMSPANSSANEWVKANRSKLPLGTISFKAPKEPPGRIQWS